MWFLQINKLIKLEYYYLCGKVNFSVIHATHITMYSFWRTMFSSKVLQITGKSYILTVKYNGNWIFLISSVLSLCFLWSLRLDYIANFLLLTAWKVSKYSAISGPYFPVFGLNTRKHGPELTPYLDTFHAVVATDTSPAQTGCSRTQKWIL